MFTKGQTFAADFQGKAIKLTVLACEIPNMDAKESKDGKGAHRSVLFVLLSSSHVCSVPSFLVPWLLPQLPIANTQCTCCNTRRIIIAIGSNRIALATDTAGTQQLAKYAERGMLTDATNISITPTENRYLTWEKSSAAEGAPLFRPDWCERCLCLYREFCAIRSNARNCSATRFAACFSCCRSCVDQRLLILTALLARLSAV